MAAELHQIEEEAPAYKEIDNCLVRCNRRLIACNDDLGKCECKKSDEKFCNSEECINRYMSWECPADCVYGDSCQNRRFSNHQYAKIERFKTEKKGFGLRALEPIEQHIFIIQYIGEIIDEHQLAARLDDHATKEHHYVMALSSKVFIDATKQGNIARFMNHSCDPNVTTQKWVVNGQIRIGFFALRDIEVGEELTFDYQFERYGESGQECYCGSSNCRGTIGIQIENKCFYIEEDGIVNNSIESGYDSLENESLENDDNLTESGDDLIKNDDNLLENTQIKIKKHRRKKRPNFVRSLVKVEPLDEDPEKLQLINLETQKKKVALTGYRIPKKRSSPQETQDVQIAIDEPQIIIPNVQSEIAKPQIIVLPALCSFSFDEFGSISPNIVAPPFVKRIKRNTLDNRFWENYSKMTPFMPKFKSHPVRNVH